MSYLLLNIGDDLFKILKNYLDDFRNNPALLLLFLLSFGCIYLIINFSYKFIKKNDPNLEKKEKIAAFIKASQKLIQYDKIEQVINDLLEFDLVQEETALKKRIIQLSNRYNHLIKQENNESELYEVERNRIVLALLNILEEIERN